MKLRAHLLVHGLLTAAMASGASAQTYQGGLRGVVRDTSGAVLPGSSVTLIHELTSVARTMVTNARGEYVFASLSPGTYSLNVDLNGFAPYSSSGLELRVQDFLVVNVTLELGGVEESITVTGETPLLQAGTASIGSAIDKAELDVLPSSGRNIFLISMTTPNVVFTGDPFFARQIDQNNSSNLALGGGSLRSNNYTLDGVAITDMRNRAVVIPSFEAVEEMKVQVSTYDAEMGRTGGGVFNTVLKSGNNRWHGSALWQTRPKWGRSKTFFEDLADLETPDIPYHLGGGSFGGPIVRDKTFLWMSAEGFRQTDHFASIFHFPTPAMARGDFSATGTTIYDPLSLDADGNRLPFPGNVIPAERLDPVGLALAGQLASVGSGHVTSGAALNIVGYQTSVKVNHAFSDAWQLAGTYLFYDSDEPFGQSYEELVGSRPAFDLGIGVLRTVHTLAVNNTYVPSDTSVLALRYGYTSFDDSVSSGEFTSAEAEALGWKGDWLSQIEIQNFPQITVDGYGFNGRTHGGAVNRPQTYDSQEVSGTYSLFVRSHTIKVGGQWRRLGLDVTSADNFRFAAFADFTEGPDPRNPVSGSGDALASLLLGLPMTTGSFAVDSTPNQFFIDYFAGFVQDDWRVGANLLLTLGLRLEHETGLFERNNNFTVGFSRDDPFPIQVEAPSELGNASGFPLRGGLVYAGVDGAPTHQWDPPAVKLGPRAGFTYSLDDDTVVRGGYGLFWAPYALPSGTTESRLGTAGFTASTQYNGSFDGITPASPGSGAPGSLTDPYPSGLIAPTGSSLGLLTQAGGTVDFNDQFRQSPYFQKWSIDIQRDIGNVVVSVGYLGSKGSNLGIGGTGDNTVNINQLDPRYLAMGFALDEPVPNPFLGQPELGALSQPETLPRGQLLRPFPHFRDVFAHHVTAARSRYDSVRVELEKRFRGNWGARVNYTWSRQRDNVYEDQATMLDEPRVVFNNSDIDGDYGLSRIDVPHTVNLNGLYRLPSPIGGFAEILLGDWSVAATAMFRSGFPLTITQRANNLGGAYGFDHQRPNLTGVDPNVSGATEDIFDNYVNPDAFENAPAFTFGDAPHTLGEIRSPKLVNWDASFEKITALGSTAKLAFRIEVINLFNGVSWRGPRSVFGRSDFGRIQGIIGFPRTLQFMVKMTF